VEVGNLGKAAAVADVRIVGAGGTPVGGEVEDGTVSDVSTAVAVVFVTVDVVGSTAVVVGNLLEVSVEKQSTALTINEIQDNFKKFSIILVVFTFVSVDAFDLKCLSPLIKTV